MSLPPKPSGQWFQLAHYQTFGAATPNRFALRISSMVALLARAVPGKNNARNHFRVMTNPRVIVDLYGAEITEYVHILECSHEMKALMERVCKTPLKPECVGFSS